MIKRVHPNPDIIATRLKNGGFAVRSKKDLRCTQTIVNEKELPRLGFIAEQTTVIEPMEQGGYGRWAWAACDLVMKVNEIIHHINIAATKEKGGLTIVAGKEWFPVRCEDGSFAFEAKPQPTKEEIDQFVRDITDELDSGDVELCRFVVAIVLDKFKLLY